MFKFSNITQYRSAFHAQIETINARGRRKNMINKKVEKL
jgi:hypothetical protein